MRSRWTTLIAASLATLSLAACGTPNDIPTAGRLGDQTGQTAIAETETAVADMSAAPTPTFVVATAEASDAPEATDVADVEATEIAEMEATAEAEATEVAEVETTETAAPATTTTTAITTTAPLTTTAEVAHPVAVVIADEFNVPVTEVEQYHAAGLGYGVLAQFYGISNGRCGATSSYSVAQLVAMKQGGMGMGEIRKQALDTASAKECSLGKLKHDDLAAADEPEVEQPKAAKPVKPDRPESPKAAPPAKPAQPAKPAKPAQSTKPPKPAKPAPAPQHDNGNHGGNQGGGNHGGGKGKK